MPTIDRTFTFNAGPAGPGLATVGYMLVPGGTRTTTGVSNAPSGTAIYQVTISLDSTFAGAILWDTGSDDPSGTPRYASEDVTPVLAVLAAVGGGGGGGGLTDLVTLSDAQAALASSLPVGGSVTQGMVSAASRLVRRYTNRDFTLTDYDETYNGMGYSEIILRQYPVSAVSRVSTNLMTVLSVANSDMATNQRATAALQTTGDFDAGLSTTGLTLSRTASGVTTTDTSTLFATYPTLTAVASHITSLGNGWGATVADGYALWPSADLKAPQGAQNALTGTGAAGAAFQSFVTDANNWTLQAEAGKLRLNNQQWDPVFALMNIAGSPLLSTFPPGFQNLRVQYTAGYNTVPYDVQQACLVTIKAMVYQLQQSGQFKSESVKDWSYTLFEHKGLPQEAMDILNAGGWRAYRRY